jgi:hypothetical protein
MVFRFKNSSAVKIMQTVWIILNQSVHQPWAHEAATRKTLTKDARPHLHRSFTMLATGLPAGRRSGQSLARQRRTTSGPVPDSHLLPPVKVGVAKLCCAIMCPRCAALRAHLKDCA